MQSDSDSRLVAGMIRRQGISLPPEREPAVAATAAEIEAAAVVLGDRLTFAEDVYGFLAHQNAWRRGHGGV